MKINKQQLQHLIQEELQNVLQEQSDWSPTPDDHLRSLRSPRISAGTAPSAAEVGTSAQLASLLEQATRQTNMVLSLLEGLQEEVARAGEGRSASYAEHTSEEGGFIAGHGVGLVLEVLKYLRAAEKTMEQTIMGGGSDEF